MFLRVWSQDGQHQHHPPESVPRTKARPQLVKRLVRKHEDLSLIRTTKVVAAIGMAASTCIPSSGEAEMEGSWGGRGAH